MAGENDILHYVNSGAFKNFNQLLGSFEDSVEGAYNFNDSSYVSAKSDMDHAANHEAESDPHFTVNSNDSRYVAIDSVKSLISQKTDKQQVLMHGHQGWNVRHGLCHIYMIYVYIYELFIAFVCFVVCSLL